MIAEELIVVVEAPGTSGERRPGPYHRQVYEQVRRAILEGRLRAGDRLPATRDLASRLGLARNTVARAYGDLLAEGYLEGKVGSGTYVAAELDQTAPAPADGSRPAAPSQPSGGPGPGSPAATPPGLSRPDELAGLSAWGRRASSVVVTPSPTSPLPFDFRPGTPDWGAFPRTLWQRLLGRALRGQATELTRYGEPAGHFPLRQAIARHLAVSRGVVASPEQVVIVSGSQQALDLLARLRVDPGDAVAVEDPGYPEARRTFAAFGAEVLPIPVDEEGMDVAALARKGRAATPRLVYLTPSHQFPTGVTLSLARRLALLEWAARRDALIVEDDYDSEFRYAGRPVESLQGLDRAGRVVYLGTFSTVLFPPLRVGYVVLPPALVAPFVRAKWLADRQTATLEQLALADFLAEGHFERHLRRMRRLAAGRRQALLDAIAAHLGDLIETPEAGTGMHLMLRIKSGPNPPTPFPRREAGVVAEAAARGVGVYPVGPCRVEPRGEPALLLGYAAVPEDRIREGVRRLAEAIRATS